MIQNFESMQHISRGNDHYSFLYLLLSDLINNLKPTNPALRWYSLVRININIILSTLFL